MSDKNKKATKTEVEKFGLGSGQEIDLTKGRQMRKRTATAAVL